MQSTAVDVLPESSPVGSVNRESARPSEAAVSFIRSTKASIVRPVARASARAAALSEAIRVA